MQKKIIHWIKEQVKKSKSQGVVLGLSGGVDSAVVAALARKAMGEKRVLALLLPCHSLAEDLRDALIVARRLGICTKKVDLSLPYDALLKVLPKLEGVAKANIKPRLRMLALYYFANKLNYLVCGTGNKSEIMAGYFTKYGDGGVDILPIGDLLKREVWKLAQELNIPQSVISKAPSAGLWPGQTDEGEMGITYSELDDILERMLSGRRQIVGANKVEKVKKKMRRSEHKRQATPTCRIHKHFPTEGRK